MIDKRSVADNADVIINGYAVNDCPEGLKVFNLNNEGHIAVIRNDGALIETNMDDIELAIATQYAIQSLKYKEVL